jgi:dTDP-4-amino-4,6-dideoxygalactose transaminase
MDACDVEERITHRTAAILCVDVYGMSSVSVDILNVAANRDIPVIVDAAPSFGTHVMSKPNAYMAPSIYSFHATKQMAVGEGGCLSSINKNLLDRCKRIRNFGLDGQIWTEPGINGKMTEISALIGLENMKTFPERMLRRRAVKQKLDEAMLHVNHVRIIPEPKGQLVSWLYCPVLIEDGALTTSSDPSSPRDVVVKYLSHYGIQTRNYYDSLSTSTPVANDIASRVIALPCYETLTDKEIDRIKTAFLDILGGRE